MGQTAIKLRKEKLLSTSIEGHFFLQLHPLKIVGTTGSQDHCPEAEKGQRKPEQKYTVSDSAP